MRVSVSQIRCIEPDDTHSGSNSMVSASHRIANSVCSHVIDIFPAPRARERGGAQVSVLFVLAMVGCKAPESGLLFTHMVSASHRITNSVCSHAAAHSGANSMVSASRSFIRYAGSPATVSA